MAGTFTSLHYHLVFSTKDRFPLINGELQPRLYEYLGGIVRSEEGCLIAVGGMPDHVHLLLRWPAKRAVADALRVIKSKSSGWVHQTFPQSSKFAWQEGYGAFSVSRSDLERVEEYIRNQAEHHRVRGFKEEFVRFLEAHGIGWDERYIWE